MTTNRPEFAAQLIALGQHLTQHPTLPRIYHVLERREEGFEIRLISDQGDQALSEWAATLDGPITSHAYRYPGVLPGGDGHVGVHIFGSLGGHQVEIIGTLADDAVPAEFGRHEWTVPR